jgi:prolyl-tRNA synthetase
MGAVVTGPDGQPVTVEMGSYGIGVSRVVAALIEASHDDAGIIWPDQVAPYKVALINLKVDDEACRSTCDGLYARLQAAGIDVIYDDRNERPGAKFADMDLIGIPWQLTIGPRGLKAGTAELKRRATGEKLELPLEEALAKVMA